LFCFFHAAVTVTHLYSVVAEEQASVGAHSHLEAGGAAPNRRLPNQEGEGATLIAPVARAEHVCDEKKARTESRVQEMREQERKVYSEKQSSYTERE